MRTSRLMVIGLALALVFVIPSVQAQPVAYGHTIGDSFAQTGTAIDVDAAGNVYVLGQSSTVNGSDSNVLVAKFDPVGVLLWQRQLNLTEPTTPIDLVVDASGDVFFDATLSPYYGSQYGVLAGLDPNGTFAFATQFPMTPNGLAWNPATSSVVVTGDGALGYGNGFVASFSTAGSLQWMRSAAASESASAWGVSVDAQGNIYVAVDRPQLTSASIAEFSGNGTPRAQRVLNQLGSAAYTWDTGVSPSGTVFFLGYDTGRSIPIVAGFNTTLSPLWSEYVNGTVVQQQFIRLAAHPDGTFYAVGQYYNYSSQTQGSAVLHVAGNGTLITDETYDSSEPAGSYQFADAAVETDGSLLLVGSSDGTPARDSHTEGSLGLVPTPGSWIVGNVIWATNTTTASAASVTVFDPGLPVDDFRFSASSQLWWGAIGVPAASLSVNVTADVAPPGSSNRTVNFTSSVAGGSTPYSYRWSFGDGTFGSDANPVHTYTQAGIYPVQLWVNDSLSHRGYNYTEVTLEGPPVITSLVASPNMTYVYYGVAFYASAYDPSGGSITNYHWDFGDHTTADSSYGFAFHNFYVEGNYTVNLTVSDSEGLTATASVLVQVLDQPPYACVSMYPNPALVGLNVSFSSCSWDPDGYIASYSWNFGDGSAGSNSSSGSHVYQAAGTYTVTLKVTDNAGLAATTFVNETVYVNLPPVASFTIHVLSYSNVSQNAPGPNQTVEFDGSGSQARNVGSYLQEFVWDFGDGMGEWQYNYPYAYHAYAVAGRTYRVTLTVYDSYGASNSTSRSLYVDVPPVASIALPRAYAKVGTPFVVNGSASTDSDGTVRQWFWDFGDGAKGSGPVASHVYAATGVYTVTLEILDDNGLGAATQASVSVVEPKTPSAILAFAPSRPLVGADVSFNASQSIDPDGAITTYDWQFGDGSTASGAVATHAYAAPGTYTVILTILDEDGMTSSSTSTIQVISRPVAGFVVAPSNPATGDAVSFSAQGSSDLSGALTYAWSFGDGSYGSGWAVTHAYAQPGTYQVTLTVTNTYGMNATETQTVVVSAPAFGASAVGVIGWLGLGLAVGAGAVALAMYLLNRRRKGGGSPPPA